MSAPTALGAELEQYDPADAAARYFAALWRAVPPGAPLGASIVYPATDGTWRTAQWRTLDDRAAFVADALKAADDGRNVYVPVCPHATPGPSRGRGKAEDVGAVLGLWADLDRYGPGHAADNLPRTWADVAGILDAASLPAPSLLVDTGGGWHAYWLADDPPAVTDDNRAELVGLLDRFGRHLTATAVALGFHVDKTSDLPRVLRVPGTTRRKAGTGPVAVRLVLDDGPRYQWAELVALIPAPVTPERPSPSELRLTTSSARVCGPRLAEIKRDEWAGMVADLAATSPGGGPAGGRMNTLRDASYWAGRHLALVDDAGRPVLDDPGGTLWDAAAANGVLHDEGTRVVQTTIRTGLEAGDRERPYIPEEWRNLPAERDRLGTARRELERQARHDGHADPYAPPPPTDDDAPPLDDLERDPDYPYPDDDHEATVSTTTVPAAASPAVVARLADHRHRGRPEHLEHDDGPSRADMLEAELLTVAQLRDLPPPAWQVSGVLPAVGVGVLYGPPKSGKTFAALDIGLCVATGSAWHGHAVTKGDVLYLAAEGGAAAIGQRVDAWITANSAGPGDAFKILPRRIVLDEEEDRRDGARYGRWVDALEELVRRRRPSLVVIDTLARSMVGEENSARDMGRLVAAAERLRDAGGCLVLLVHHTGKDESRGMRGSSALFGGVDVALEFGRNRDNVTLACAGMKDAEDFAPLNLRLDKVAGSLVLTSDSTATAGQLTRAEADCLTTLCDIHTGTPVSSSTWSQAFGTNRHGSFFRARKRLVELGMVQQESQGSRSWYTPTDLGLSAVGGAGPTSPTLVPSESGTTESTGPMVPPPYRGGTSGTSGTWDPGTDPDWQAENDPYDPGAWGKTGADHDGAPVPPEADGPSGTSGTSGTYGSDDLV